MPDVFARWPWPGPRVRTLRRRGWARLRAFLGGYFWLPCPLCGQRFGGHETSDMAVYDPPSSSHGKIVCRAHDPIWPPAAPEVVG